MPNKIEKSIRVTPIMYVVDYKVVFVTYHEFGLLERQYLTVQESINIWPGI